MKKWIAIILTIALLAVSVSALAVEDAQNATDTVTSATQAQKQKQSDSQTSETDPQDAQSKYSKESQHGQARKNAKSAQAGTETLPRQESVQEQKARKDSTAKKSPFDAFAAQGVISQETADQIKAYLRAKKAAKVSEEPSDETSEETAPENGGKAPRQQGKKGKIQVTQELLQELLDAEIITPTEYDAMLPAQTEATD